MGVKRLANIMLIAIFCVSASDAFAHQLCHFYFKWMPSISMDEDRIYQNQQSGLLEYTTSDQGRKYVFSSRVEPKFEKAQLNLTIKFGASPFPFRVSVSGARDAKTGKNVQFVAKPGQHVTISRSIIVKEKDVTINIRSDTKYNAKIWVFVEEAALCPSDE